MKSLKSHIFACAFAAMICAGAFISFPLPGFPVPIVAQNMFVILAGLALGPMGGLEAVGIFIFMGALGFPVFAGGKGGLAHLAGPSGGYLAGYLAAGCISGLIAGSAIKTRSRGSLANIKFWMRLSLAALASVLVIYAFGATRLKFIFDYSWGKAFFVGVIPFLPGDAVKALAAAVIAAKLGPFLQGQLSFADKSLESAKK